MNVKYQNLGACVITHASTHQARMSVNVILDIVYQVMDSCVKVCNIVYEGNKLLIRSADDIPTPCVGYSTNSIKL